MAVTTHMCRGNFRSSWVAEGGYDFVAEALFDELDVDGFFMEYDDARSGGFEPLRFVPKGKLVVLGLVTTKRGELEAKDELKRRIEEASQYVDLDQLCLSPQCGFSSTVEGNALTARAAGRQAAADRRDRRGGLGLSAAYVYDAIRTPFGRYGGALAGVRPDDLAAHVVRELLARSPELDPERIDDVVFGNANGAGEDNRNVARMAVLLAGLPTSVPGATVNRLCGSEPGGGDAGASARSRPATRRSCSSAASSR